MSFCTFADGAAMFDVTPIENMFLVEHMYDAPAPALKVYLYARMLALHPELGGSMSDMALALRMERKASSPSLRLPFSRGEGRTAEGFSAAKAASHPAGAKLSSAEILKAELAFGTSEEHRFTAVKTCDNFA